MNIKTACDFVNQCEDKKQSMSYKEYQRSTTRIPYDEMSKKCREEKENEKAMAIKWRVAEVETTERSRFAEMPTILAQIVGTPNGYAERIGISNSLEFKKYIEDRLNKGNEDDHGVEIKNVIFNPPATIVFWSDGTKTVVKAQGELFDPEKGLAMAMIKKAMGNQGNYFNEIKKWTANYPRYEVRVDRNDGRSVEFHPFDDLISTANATDEALKKVVEAAKSLLTKDTK